MSGTGDRSIEGVGARGTPRPQGGARSAFRRVALALLALPAILIVGFWVPYLSLIPRFPADMTPVVHVHALVQFAWVGVLLVQPLAVANGAFRLHRVLGRASYVLMALIVVLGCAVMAQEYGEAIAAGRSARAAAYGEYLSAGGLALVVMYYGLAMRAIRGRDVGAHMRYMIAIAIALAPAGIGRALGYWLGVRFVNSSTLSLAFVDCALLALLAVDRARGASCRPYGVAFAAYAGFELGWLLLGRPL